MSRNSISVSGLKKYYGPVRAVDGISFEVEAGSIFGMLGPNGAGKTTTIETLIGLLKKDEGRIEILGLDSERELKKIKESIGVQLQSPSLFPRLTVRETVELFASFYPDPLPVEVVIERVGLSSKTDTQVRALSGGQKHRLAVGLAMVSNGKIIFLDEPTTGLDPQARRQLWDVILQLREEGVTVFITTHYMEEAEKLCDKLAIIDQGRLIARGSPGELITEHLDESAVELSDPGFSEDERRWFEESELINRVKYVLEEEKIILYTAEIPLTIKQLLEYGTEVGKEIKDLRVRHASLEDVFLKLTGRGIRE